MTGDVRAARARITGSLSQRTFDVLLRTLSEPGSVAVLPDELPDDVPATLWLALALADVDTPVHVHGDPGGTWGRVVAAATGAPLVAVDRARIVVPAGPSAPPLDRVVVGTATAPEDGAKVALPVTSLTIYPDPDPDPDPETGPGPGADGTMWSLTGPGVPGRRRLRLAGVEADLHRRVGRASGAFPTGFDLWLVATGRDASGTRVAAVPRSATVETTVPSDDEQGGH